MRRKEGREGKRNEEEGGSRTKEGQGGRRDEESEKMKNEKVAKGRIIGLTGPCSQMHDQRMDQWMCQPSYLSKNSLIVINRYT